MRPNITRRLIAPQPCAADLVGLRTAGAQGRVVRVVAILFALPMLATWPSPPAVAEILTVDTLSTEAPVVNGNCTLIEAVQAANADVAVDACPAGTGEDEVRLPAGEMVFTVPFAGGSSALPAIDAFVRIRGTGT